MVVFVVVSWPNDSANSKKQNKKTVSETNNPVQTLSFCLCVCFLFLAHHSERQERIFRLLSSGLLVVANNDLGNEAYSSAVLLDSQEA